MSIQKSSSAVVPTNEGPSRSSAQLHPAIEAALIENHAMFLRFLARRVGNTGAAEDVLQEFYLRVISRGAELRKAESVVAWLYTVLRTTLVDHYRKEAVRRRKEAHYSLMQVADEESWAVQQLAQSKTCECLNRALLTIKPEYSDVLRRVDLRGAPARKVASDMAITANNLRVRLHRARRELKQAMRKHGRICAEDDCLVCDFIESARTTGPAEMDQRNSL